MPEEESKLSDTPTPPTDPLDVVLAYVLLADPPEQGGDGRLHLIPALMTARTMGGYNLAAAETVLMAMEDICLDCLLLWFTLPPSARRRGFEKLF